MFHISVLSWPAGILRVQAFRISVCARTQDEAREGDRHIYGGYHAYQPIVSIE
jgi:hypothetical protein